MSCLRANMELWWSFVVKTGLKPLTNFEKSSIVGVWLGLNYLSGTCSCYRTCAWITETIFHLNVLQYKWETGKMLSLTAQDVITIRLNRRKKTSKQVQFGTFLKHVIWSKEFKTIITNTRRLSITFVLENNYLDS